MADSEWTAHRRMLAATNLQQLWPGLAAHKAGMIVDACVAFSPERLLRAAKEIFQGRESPHPPHPREFVAQIERSSGAAKERGADWGCRLCGGLSPFVVRLQSGERLLVACECHPLPRGATTARALAAMDPDAGFKVEGDAAPWVDHKRLLMAAGMAAPESVVTLTARQAALEGAMWRRLELQAQGDPERKERLRGIRDAMARGEMPTL